MVTILDAVTHMVPVRTLIFVARLVGRRAEGRED
jgi:hypothetical protein